MSLLETLYGLESGQYQLLHSAESNGELITVRQYQHYRWLTVGGEMIQSLIDLEQPEQVLLPNLQAMLLSLEFIEMPTQVLNLGAGGGVFDRFFHARYPQVSMISVESHALVTELAARYFHLPDASEIINTTAEAYLADHQAQYDLILCDIFSGENHPDCLYQPDFYNQIEICLASGGMLAINLLAESEEALLPLLRPFKDQFAWVLLYEVKNHDNVIIYLLKDQPKQSHQLLEKLSEFQQQYDMELHLIAQNPDRL